MIYDGVITKPELTEDNMLMHWGVKGMRWKKRLKGGYYKTKSKLAERYAKFNRNLNLHSTMDVTNNRGSSLKKPGTYRVYEALGVNPKELSGKIQLRDMKMNGKANSQSGQEGSRVNAGTAAGRRRMLEKALKKNSITRPKSRKKTVASGSASVKKRGKA